MTQVRSVDDAIARFDELIARYDGRTPAAAGAARRSHARTVKSVGRRIAYVAMAVAALIAGAFAFGLLIAPIGIGGFVALIAACVVAVGLLAFWPGEPERLAYSDQMPTRTLVQQFDSYLVRQRRALPAPAAQRIDAISAQLPLLESRLDQVDLLDPLAQDARRLMGKHLPELIDRYERVPQAYRGERDGAGMTVDERLVSSLDAAREALDEIGAKLAKEDLTAFETQGRFIESRYKEGDGFKPE